MEYEVTEVTEKASLTDYNTLLKDCKRREEFISRIKAEVAQEWDNINNPVPLFAQLSSQPAGGREC